MANLRTMTTIAQKSTENANSPFCNHFSIIASHLNNYPGIKFRVQELGRIKLKIRRQVLASPTQLLTRLFHVLDRIRTMVKCTKTKYALENDIFKVFSLFLAMCYFLFLRSCLLLPYGCLRSAEEVGGGKLCCFRVLSSFKDYVSSYCFIQ